MSNIEKKFEDFKEKIESNLDDVFEEQSKIRNDIKFLISWKKSVDDSDIINRLDKTEQLIIQELNETKNKINAMTSMYNNLLIQYEKMSESLNKFVETWHSEKSKMKKFVDNRVDQWISFFRLCIGSYFLWLVLEHLAGSPGIDGIASPISIIGLVAAGYLFKTNPAKFVNFEFFKNGEKGG